MPLRQASTLATVVGHDVRRALAFFYSAISFLAHLLVCTTNSLYTNQDAIPWLYKIPTPQQAIPDVTIYSDRAAPSVFEMLMAITLVKTPCVSC
ncbi:hypothetical protein RNAN_1117 [Rheinheimera nanhaiensis E407-8]|uniref:Uncharacterized protein n=1 Tax=Rheinheimera nanhaiensis E407-8 TaxID=562729 RepID=I1DVR8_9GAMM|nr:hypothetical protein RNAN_1117 [Rheinheimera nanhaiensis E407-8]